MAFADTAGMLDGDGGARELKRVSDCVELAWHRSQETHAYTVPASGGLTCPTVDLRADRPLILSHHARWA